MGEARRRKLRGDYPVNERGQALVTEIGAETVLYESAGEAHIYPAGTISIRELEDRARAFLADDPEPFVPAAGFVKETRQQPMPGGKSVAMLVDVHPDPRVQRVLHVMREAALERAYSEASLNKRIRQVVMHSGPAFSLAAATRREEAGPGGRRAG